MCQNLVTYYIDEKMCKGCSLCARNYPVGAIYKEGEVFKIDEEKCIRCGVCKQTCPFGAVKIKGVA